MNYEPIRKPDISKIAVKPNLLDYKKFREKFRWEDVRRELEGFED